MPARPIVVVGSINMDLVCRTPRLPKPGETVLGTDFLTIPGGKGANQAVAAARLGGAVRMVGRVGEDDFGQRLLTGLEHHHVGLEHVTVTEGISSGVAMIVVDRKGENAIIPVPGANGHLSPEDIDAAADTIRSAGVVVMQLEIPLPTVRHVIAMCREAGVFTILDPAPVPPRGLPRALHDVDILTPNESEAADLARTASSGRGTGRKRPDVKQIASDLLARGARCAVLKLGAKGAMILAADGQIERIRPHRIKAVDTTAAGDAFTGALAVALAEGRPLADAVRFANAAGALCCTKLGAQPAIPHRADVDALVGA